MDNKNQSNVRAIVVAALYDFAGALTTRKNPITAGETHDASPMAQAVKEFIDKRGCDLVQDPPIKEWQDKLREEEAMQQAREALSPARDFREDLTRCINRWSQDNHFGMPDYVLADMVYEMFTTVRRANVRTKEFLGTEKRFNAECTYGTPLPVAHGATMVAITPSLDFDLSKVNEWPDFTKDLNIKRTR